MKKNRPSEESLAKRLERVHEDLIAQSRNTNPDAGLPGQGMLMLIKQVKELEDRDSTNSTINVSAEQTEGPKVASARVSGSLAEQLKSVGRFEIERLIGQGGFGLVFLAHDPELGREVALKIPRAQAVLTPELRERFLKEGRSAASLAHPNIVPVYEAGKAEELCYIATQYIPGETLVDLLARKVPVPNETTARVIAVLAEAVGHAHQRGILHRDIKPANILVKETAEEIPLEARVLLTDFGLAKDIGEENGFTKTDVLVGTPAYMSPEQIGDHANVSRRSDVYSLGVLFFELLSGQPPFKRETVFKTIEAVKNEPPPRIKSFGRYVHADLEAICFKCLEKSPEARYQTAFELKDDLLRWVEGKPVRARKLGPTTRFIRHCKRFPVVSSLVVAMTLMAATAFGWIVMEKNKTFANFVASEKNAAAASVAEKDAKEAQQRAAKNFARAERNFQHSREAVEKMLIEVGDQLRDIPYAQKARRNVLATATDYFQSLTDEDSDDPEVQFDSAQAFQNIAMIHSKLGEIDEAKISIKKSINQFAELIKNKADSRYERGLAISYSNYSHFYAQQSKFRKAIEQAGMSQEHWGNYFDTTEEIDQLAKREHGTALFSTATIHGLLKQHEPAIKTYQKIIDLYEQTANDSANLTLRLLIPRCYNNLGNQFRRTGQPEKANELVLRASGMLDQLLGIHPDNPKVLETFSHNLVACADAVGGSEGEEFIKRSFEVSKRLIGQYPTIVRHRQSLGLANSEFAMKLKVQKRIDEAEEHFLNAYKLMKPIHAKRPAILRNTNNLAFTANELADIYRASGRDHQAVEFFTTAVNAQQTLAQRQPTKKNTVLFAQRSLALAKQLIKLGQHSKAAACVEPIDEHTGDNAVCVFWSADIVARCHTSVDKDENLDASEKLVAKEEYFDDVLARLKHSLDLGVNSTKGFHLDHSHWDPFRETEVFQDLTRLKQVTIRRSKSNLVMSLVLNR